MSEEESKGSVLKARRYAARIEELRLTHHRKVNEHYYTSIEGEGEDESKVFRVYAISRSSRTIYPIFECPLHQAILRDFYVSFRLCGHNLKTLAEYFQENDNRLPPTGLPLSPETQLFRDYTAVELAHFRHFYFGQQV